MKKHITGERIANTALFLISAFYLAYSAVQYKVGTIKSPKAGMLPLILGVLAVIISAFLAVQSYMGKGDAKNVRLNLNWPRFGALIAVSLLYAFTLKTVGYVIGTFAFLFLVLKIARVNGWLKPLIISAVSSVAFYFIFKTMLSVMLPVGWFGW